MKPDNDNRGSEMVPEIVESHLLSKAGIAHAFATRKGGVSTGSFDSLNFSLKGGDAHQNIQRNLAILSRHLSMDPSRIFRVKQVHGSAAVIIDAASEPTQIIDRPADVIMTQQVGIGVGVVTADCVPVLFASHDGHAVAAAHAGWRGIVAGVLESTVETFQRSF